MTLNVLNEASFTRGNAVARAVLGGPDLRHDEVGVALEQRVGLARLHAPQYLHLPLARHARAADQGLTLVQFAAQPEPFLTQNTP